MLFNSLPFGIFFLIVLALHYSPFHWTIKKINLILLSYVFYAAWNPPFVILLWISTLGDWFLAKGLYRLRTNPHRRIFLIFSLMMNLGLLGFFKYGNFILQNYSAFMHLLHIPYHAPSFSVILPVGISFYTFQTLSYTLDVYMERTVPAKSFLDYALYIAFFPQLVAGPIMRSEDFLPQCAAPRQASGEDFNWGLTLFLIGLFEKMVVADYLLAPAAEKIFNSPKAPGFADAWLGTLAFSGQIFCDFAGYSTCAIGSALCLGFVLIENFHCPYAAAGFSDFWRRWHISLSSWLRDYLYIPLGGNRKGKARTYFNLMLTMFLGGLWHGASWTFVIWGGLHGAYLSVERFLKGRLSGIEIFSAPLAKIFYTALTFFCVCTAWVFFRAKNLPQAWSMLCAMFGLHGFKPAAILSPIQVQTVLMVITGMLAAHASLRNKTLRETFGRTPVWLRGLAFAGAAFLIWITAGEDRAFIYFQF